jgi:hypothetical protein
MALWRVCIDDTADERKEGYVIAAALIAKVPTWQAFHRKWNQTLRQNPRIDWYHGKEFATLDGQFRQFRNPIKWPKPSGSEAATAKRNDLISLIESSDLIGCGVGVRIPDYKEVRATHPRAKTFLGTDAFEYALQAIIYETNKSIKEHDRLAKVAFISDDSDLADRYTLVYNRWKAANPKSAKSMLGIDHADDRTSAGLQATDLAASTVKKVFEDFFLRGISDADHPMRKRFYRIANVGRKYLLTMLENQSVRDSEKRRSASV